MIGSFAILFSVKLFFIEYIYILTMLLFRLSDVAY